MFFWPEVKELVREVLKKFNANHQRIILKSLQSAKSQTEIARDFELSQASISRIMIKFYSEIKKEAERRGFHEGGEQTMDQIMTIDQYKAFLARDLSIAEMSIEIGRSTKSIYNWRLRHKNEIKDLPQPKPSQPKKRNNKKSVLKPNNQTETVKKIPNHTDHSKLYEELKLLKAEKADLESKLARTEQEKDKYFQQHQALKAYVLTLLEPAK